MTSAARRNTANGYGRFDFFARFWGVLFLIFGALFIAARYLDNVIEMTDDKAFVIAAGYHTLLQERRTINLNQSMPASSRT